MPDLVFRRRTIQRRCARRHHAGRLARLAVTGPLILLLAACGNGGSGSGSDGGGGGGVGGTSSLAETLEFFQGSLYAVAPSDPTTVLVVDADAASVEDGETNAGASPFVSGEFSANGIAGVRVERLVYARSDGTLYRVSTEVVEGTPVPVRVSSESAAVPLCNVRVGLDFADSDNARFAYGSDGQDCSGILDWKLVKVTDDEMIDPQDFPGQPVDFLFDPADGSHAGWLTVDGGELMRLAPDLSVQANGLIDVADGAESLGYLANGVMFLEIDGGLYSFDPMTDRLLDFGFDLTGKPCLCDLRFAVDLVSGFFYEREVLYRADVDTGEIVELDAPADAIDPGGVVVPGSGLTRVLFVGSNRVAWSYVSDSDGKPATVDDQAVVIRSVAKDGSDAMDIDVLTVGEGPMPLDPTGQSENVGDWIFYNVASLSEGGLQPSAIAARLDGTDVERFTDSRWIGNSFSADAASAGVIPVDRMLRLDGQTDLRDMQIGDLTLSSLEAADPLMAPLDLGRLPSDSEGVLFLPGLGPERIGISISMDGFGDGQSDILYLNSEESGSLELITDTNGTNEFPAPFF